MTDTLTEHNERTFFQKISGVLHRGAAVDEECVETLEEALITADVGVHVTDGIIRELKEKYFDKRIESEEELTGFIKAHMAEALKEGDRSLNSAVPGTPSVILVVGVNGTGKTTSIGKLAHMFIGQGKKVILGAGDTFRAAAGEQIGKWAERTGADIVSHKEGGDPAAVIYDTVEAGIARAADYIILDTAGRLHTKHDLMKQLEKIDRVIKKKIPDAPHEVLLVIDATAGQNGLAQARKFYEDLGVTGIFLAKMDGTARGGIVFAIKKELSIPVKFVGTGERPEDMQQFDPEQFVERIFFSEDSGSLNREIGSGLEQKMSRTRINIERSRLMFRVLIVLLVLSAVVLTFSLVFGDIWLRFISDIIEVTGLDTLFD